MVSHRCTRRFALGGLLAGLLFPFAAGARPPRRRPVPRAALPVIVVDPGHGGDDPGAIGLGGTREKSVTLAAGLAVKRALEATGRYAVRLTRSRDVTLGLAERAALARRTGAVLMISLHADIAPSRRVRGASVYIRAHGAGTAHASARLRQVLLKSLAGDVALSRGPSREARLYVLACGVPAVLLEMGYLSNARDEAALRNPAHQRAIARSVREAVDAYFARLRENPASRT